MKLKTVIRAIGSRWIGLAGMAPPLFVLLKKNPGIIGLEQRI